MRDGPDPHGFWRGRLIGRFAVRGAALWCGPQATQRSFGAFGDALSFRLRAFWEAAPNSEADEDRPVSGVVEYRPHADGPLQKEVRTYYRKDGTPKEQGPYWYFRYHEGGKQKKLYLGKTDDPEGELDRRRPQGRTRRATI